jgi:hypothetical protein
VSGAPARAIRIHFYFTFTSLALAGLLRCGEATESVGRTAQAVTSDDSREVQMNMTKVLGLAAVGGLLVLAAPAERAQALSLSNPGAADSGRFTADDHRSALAPPPLASLAALAPLVISGSPIVLGVSDTGSRGGLVFFGAMMWHETQAPAARWSAP